MSESNSKPKTTNARIVELEKKVATLEKQLNTRLENSLEFYESRMTEIENVLERLSAGKSWWADAKRRLGAK